MNREEILEKSQAEHKKQADDPVLYANGKAASVGMLVGVVLCSIVLVLNLFVGPKNDELTPVCLMIYCGMSGSNNIASYKHLKKRYRLITGIAYTALAVVFAVLFILGRAA